MEQSEEYEKDYKIVYKDDDKSEKTEDILTAELVQKQAESWMYNAMKSFDKQGMQYSVTFNESQSGNTDTTIDDLKKLALNAQNDISKIQKINVLIRQALNEDDIIGKVYESVESNLNSNVKISFENLPENYDKDIKQHAEDTIKRFHKEVHINDLMTSAITSTYIEGNDIHYLRSKKNGKIFHHVIDKYPLGVAIISDYSVNSIPNVLIDTSELTSRLQKTTLRNKKNKPLFFANTTEEIKNNYPKEVIDAYVNRDKYAKLDIRRTGVNRFGNLGRPYGLSPIFKALKPKIMLDTFDKSDAVNAKAKEKKIITQIMRKETLGENYTKKGLEDMAYAHSCLMAAWANPTVVYTPPPCVEAVKYVEPTSQLTDEKKVAQYRSRVTSALGISFMNTDGQQTVSTANISIKQLMKTINKIAERQEEILQRWYEVVFAEENIPIEYCPTPTILDAELLEQDIRKDLAEFLFSKLNCSFTTAYEILGYNFENELEKRKEECENDTYKYMLPHATSYNSSGSKTSGRPLGSTSDGNDVNEQKQDYDQNYQQSI